MPGNYCKRFSKRLTTLCLCLMLVLSLFWGCRTGPQPDHAQMPAPMDRPVPAARQDVVEEKVLNLAEDLTRQFDYPHPRIVIGYFVLDGNRTNFLGERVYEILSAYISGKYGRAVMICDRRKMSDIMAELKLQQSRLFDVNTIAEIGRFAGANLMVAGEIRRMGRNRVSISAQLIEIETMVNHAFAVTPFFQVSEDYLEKLEAVRLKNTDLAIPFDYLVHGYDAHVKHIYKGDLLLERGEYQRAFFEFEMAVKMQKEAFLGYLGKSAVRVSILRAMVEAAEKEGKGISLNEKRVINVYQEEIVDNLENAHDLLATDRVPKWQQQDGRLYLKQIMSINNNIQKRLMPFYTL